jgi:hypothetical protein
MFGSQLTYGQNLDARPHLHGGRLWRGHDRISPKSISQLRIPAAGGLGFAAFFRGVAKKIILIILSIRSKK